PSKLYSSVSAMAWNAMPPKIKGDGLLNDNAGGLIVKKITWADGLESEEAIDLTTGTSDIVRPPFLQVEDIFKHLDCLRGDWANADFSYLRKIRKSVGDNAALSGTAIDPVSAVGWYLGIESLMYLFFAKPEILKKLCDEFCDICLETSVAMIENGMDLIRLGAATACLFSPDIFLEFCAPYQRRICDAVRDAGGLTHLHMCGNVKNLLKPVLKSKADILETITPPPLGDTTMSDAKKTIGRKICVKGNLNPIGALKDGTPEEALQEAKECLREGMKGGAFIFSVADNLAPGTPEENIAVIAEYITSL
ncbi:MAG: uroporphyrinogen decarboxylase family protein, partial [Victivallaceae bacterium]|nr:uroporphyrinogen decarboxylase family protein [Victivallaceae bacterium]